MVSFILWFSAHEPNFYIAVRYNIHNITNYICVINYICNFLFICPVKAIYKYMCHLTLIYIPYKQRWTNYWYINYFVHILKSVLNQIIFKHGFKGNTIINSYYESENFYQIFPFLKGIGFFPQIFTFNHP